MAHQQHFLIAFNSLMKNCFVSDVLKIVFLHTLGMEILRHLTVEFHSDSESLDAIIEMKSE